MSNLIVMCPMLSMNHRVKLWLNVLNVIALFVAAGLIIWSWPMSLYASRPMALNVILAIHQVLLFFWVEGITLWWVRTRRMYNHASIWSGLAIGLLTSIPFLLLLGEMYDGANSGWTQFFFILESAGALVLAAGLLIVRFVIYLVQRLRS